MALTIVFLTHPSVAVSESLAATGSGPAVAAASLKNVADPTNIVPSDLEVHANEIAYFKCLPDWPSHTNEIAPWQDKSLCARFVL